MLIRESEDPKVNEARERVYEAEERLIVQAALTRGTYVKPLTPLHDEENENIVAVALAKHPLLSTKEE